MGPKQSRGILYIVATPIGNLEDISARSLRILKQADLIACEDTRHTRKLLSHFAINTPVTSYYREKEQSKSDLLLGKMLNGTTVAMVSDAGTPGIADPGSILVRRARESGIQVVPIPGASALTTALSAAGLVESNFYFGGFLPAKKAQRKKLLQDLRLFSCALVFYESPHRIKSSLKDCVKVFGNRQALLFRELTKIHEQCYTGSLEEIEQQLKGPVKGEIVIIIEGRESQTDEKPEDLDDLLRWYRNQPDITLKDAVKRVAADLDLSRSVVYRKALTLWQEK